MNRLKKYIMIISFQHKKYHYETIKTTFVTNKGIKEAYKHALDIAKNVPCHIQISIE